MSETLVLEALVELLSESFRRVLCLGRMRVRRRPNQASRRGQLMPPVGFMSRGAGE